MPITVGNGVLDRFYARLSQGTIDAYVTYSLSNGQSEEKAHVGIPLAAVQARAAAQGRSNFEPQDICDVIAGGITGFAPNTITPYAPPVS
jgi:hypothetical protein